MNWISNLRALFRLSVGVLLLAALTACGGGSEADTEVPALTLNPFTNASTLERTRVLSGTVEPGAQVVVTADTAAVIGPVTVTAGTWSCSVALVPGVNTLSVQATDAVGNNLTLAFTQLYEVFTLDQVLPQTSLANQRLQGTTLVPGGALTATLDSVPLLAQPSIVNGTWTLDLGPLVGPSHSLVLTGTDTAGQVATLTQTLTVGATLPMLTVNPAAPIGNSVSLGGNATANATLSIVAPIGVTVGTITPPGVGGTWNCDLSDLLPGRNLITLTATAPGGAQATARLAVFYQP